MFSITGFLRSKRAYKALPHNEDVDLEEKDICPSPLLISRPRSSHSYFNLLPWVLCAALSVALITMSITHHKFRHQNTYETGFDTELGPANSVLGLTKVKFYGGVQIDPNGTYYLSSNPAEPNYVGPSSPELDETWDRMLLHQRYLGLTPEEVSRTDFKVDEKDWIFDLYWVSPNTFHSLHCLDYMRRSLDREYYTDIKELPPRPFRMTHRMHLDHCIEALRQTLTCSLDMTPVPRPWIPQAGIYHADIDQWHTCRDYSSVRSWMDWRNRDEKDADFINVTHRYKDRDALYAKFNPW
ncbi:hypothetical protein WAI453_001015 [Rhynchosporium graminicola]